MPVVVIWSRGISKNITFEKSLYLAELGPRSIRLFLLQVVTFQPNGTSDALHFYINGVEMDIDVAVNNLQSGTKREF